MTGWGESSVGNVHEDLDSMLRHPKLVMVICTSYPSADGQRQENICVHQVLVHRPSLKKQGEE